jgi:hypothetical protein
MAKPSPLCCSLHIRDLHFAILALSRLLRIVDCDVVLTSFNLNMVLPNVCNSRNPWNEAGSRYGANRFFGLMDQERVKATFLKFADKSTARIPSTSFRLALQGLDIQMQPDKLRQLFKEADIDEDGGLDLDEFHRAINRPSELEQWCSTLPLAKLLSFCLETPLADAAAASHAILADPVRRVSELSPQDLDRVAEEFWGGVRRLLGEQASQLNRCYAELDQKAVERADGSSAKFQTFSMSAGTVEDFHKGLTNRVGAS